VQSLGIAGMSKSEVSRLCASLDEQVQAFRERRLDAEYPYVRLDARYEHVREGGRVVSMGAAWQRCRVHFMRDVEARVPKTAQPVVAAAVPTIFQPADRAVAQAQLATVSATRRERFPTVVQLLADAEEEVFTFYDFPEEHRRQIYSTNPFERLNKELKRRSAVVGIFPNRAAVIRLHGALLDEQNDWWLVGKRYFSEGSMAKLLRPPPAAEQLELGVAAA
jgi:putative transposase